MGTLEIGAENAPGDNMAVTTANGGGIEPFNGPIYSSLGKRQGLYGYRMSSATTTLNMYIRSAHAAQAGSDTNTMRSRIYFRFSALPTGNLQQVFYMTSNSAVRLWGVRVQSNGTLVLEDGAGGTPYVSTFAVALNTWYRLEINYAPSNTLTGANSRILLWCGLADAAPSTVNSATVAYYYSAAYQASTTNSAVVPGIGYAVWGRVGTPAQPAGSFLDFDDVAVDNGTWTTTTSTWWGKATPVHADIVAMDVGSVMSIAGSSVRVVSDLFTPHVTPILGVTGAPIQKSAVLPVRGIPILVLGPTVSRDYALAAAVLARMTLASQVSRSYALAVRGTPTLAVGKGPSQITAALALAAAAALANEGIRGTSSDLSMAVASSALYGRQIDVIAGFGAGVRPTLEIATELLWQDFFLTQAVAAMELSPLRIAPSGLETRAMPALALAGRLNQSRAVAVRGTPVFLVAGRKDLSRVLSAAVVARIVLGGRLTISRSLVMGVIARMIHFGATIGEVRTYDEVLAVILSDGGASRVFEAVRLAELLDNGRRRADLLGGLFQAVPLSGGTMAVIQD